MRKITEDSVRAFFNEQPFRRANMDVLVNIGWCGLFLHGNLIAERHHFEYGSLPIIDDCGWRTATTKDRLNAILQRYGWGLYSKDGEWILWSRDHGEEIPWHGRAHVCDLVILTETIQEERNERRMRREREREQAA